MPRVDASARHSASAMSASSCDEEWRVPSAITDAAGADGERTEQVVLQRSVQAGALLLVVRKTALLPAAAWDTLQVGERQHARFGAKALKLNHSSTPNTRIGSALRASIEPRPSLNTVHTRTAVPTNF